MSQIADILLAAGAIGAGFYCFVLSVRLRRFASLEKGVGGAVALLSAQVDDLTKALSGAQESAQITRTKLTDLVQRAELTSQRLELLIAAVQDVGADAALKQPSAGPAPKESSASPSFMRRPVPEGFPR